MPSIFVRKVRTASGAIAVQIVRKDGRGNYAVLDHVGSAHTDAELELLLARCAERGYREALQRQLLAHAPEGSPALLLHDVTTLYSEVQKEDGYREPGLCLRSCSYSDHVCLEDGGQ